jgi:hypothetical protein
MLATYATGIVALVLLFLVWAGVQSAWRRTFPDAGSDPDALAGRMGCQRGHSDCVDSCDRGHGDCAAEDRR